VVVLLALVGILDCKIMQDQYLKHIMTETGTEVAVHGKGSGYLESFSGEEAQQPLHLLITGDNFKSLDDARQLADNLLETIHSDSVAFWYTSLSLQCVCFLEM
jgi:hypothetical protein